MRGTRSNQLSMPANARRSAPNLSKEIARLEQMTVGQLQDRYVEVFGERLRLVNPSSERVRPRQDDGSRPYRYQGLRLTPRGCELATNGHPLLSHDKSRDDDR